MWLFRNDHCFHVKTAKKTQKSIWRFYEVFLTGECLFPFPWSNQLLHAKVFFLTFSKMGVHFHLIKKLFSPKSVEQNEIEKTINNWLSFYLTLVDIKIGFKVFHSYLVAELRQMKLPKPNLPLKTNMCSIKGLQLAKNKYFIIPNTYLL